MVKPIDKSIKERRASDISRRSSNTSNNLDAIKDEDEDAQTEKAENKEQSEHKETDENNENKEADEKSEKTEELAKDLTESKVEKPNETFEDSKADDDSNSETVPKNALIVVNSSEGPKEDLESTKTSELNEPIEQKSNETESLPSMGDATSLENESNKLEKTEDENNNNESDTAISQNTKTSGENAEIEGRDGSSESNTENKELLLSFIV